MKKNEISEVKFNSERSQGNMGGWLDFYNRIFSKESMFSKGDNPYDTAKSIT